MSITKSTQAKQTFERTTLAIVCVLAGMVLGLGILFSAKPEDAQGLEIQQEVKIPYQVVPEDDNHPLRITTVDVPAFYEREDLSDCLDDVQDGTDRGNCAKGFVLPEKTTIQPNLIQSDDKVFVADSLAYKQGRTIYIPASLLQTVKYE